MKTTPKVVKRGNITYVLYHDKVLVGTGLNQWISYNKYDNLNREGITRFRNKIMNSEDHEYVNAIEQMSLAYECGIKGTSGRKPEGVGL